MIVVPLNKDTITTKEGVNLTVRGYVNYKAKGPAVYANNEPGSPIVVVYFFDIAKINDVNVDFISSSKIFNALGKIKREIHLPQPHDYIFVPDSGNDLSKDSSLRNAKRVKVQGYKLHSKKHGLSKGLLIEDDEKNVYRLNDIYEIKRDIGNDEFNHKRFVKIYNEYKGH